VQRLAQVVARRGDEATFLVGGLVGQQQARLHFLHPHDQLGGKPGVVLLEHDQALREAVVRGGVEVQRIHERRERERRRHADARLQRREEHEREHDGAGQQQPAPAIGIPTLVRRAPTGGRAESVDGQARQVEGAPPIRQRGGYLYDIQLRHRQSVADPADDTRAGPLDNVADLAARHEP